MTRTTLMTAALTSATLATPIFAGTGADLTSDVIGHAHVFPGGAGPWGTFSGAVPNIPGAAVDRNFKLVDTCPDGATATAIGRAFAGRTGPKKYRLKTVAKVRFALTQQCNFAHGLVLSIADPAIEPCLMSDEELLGIYGEEGPVEAVTPLDDVAFAEALAASPIGPGTPGTDTELSMIVELDDVADLVTFTVEPGHFLTALTELSGYSVGVCLQSAALGVDHAFVYDEFGLAGTAGWSPEDVSLEATAGAVSLSDPSTLNFAVPVPPDFSEADFGDIDLRLQTLISAEAAGFTPPCPADVNGDGIVDFGDVLAIIGDWGAGSGSSDANGDSIVDFGDLLFVIGMWGPCP